MATKKITIEVSEELHAFIKEMAANERTTIKDITLRYLLNGMGTTYDEFLDRQLNH